VRAVRGLRESSLSRLAPSSHWKIALSSGYGTP
jgi:hypothetical protein